MNEKENSLTPAEIESSKTPKQKAEDIAYTLNHTLVCTTTDWIDPVFGNFIQKKLGNKSQLPNAYAAEFIGDFGSIPVTIAAQRLFPSSMNWIRKAAEPIFKRIFLSSAERSAKNWAEERGYKISSEEYKQKVHKIYEYEMSHLPQAFVWTVSTVGLNVVAQRAMGNKAPIHHITAGKVGGSAISVVLTLGGRTMFPRKAEKLDKWTSQNIILPLEDKVYDTLGVKHDELEASIHPQHKENGDEKGWTDRVKTKENSKFSNITV